MIRTALTAAVLALCAAATASTAAAAAAAPDRSNLLRVTYDNGHGVVVNHVLRCHPAGGSMRAAVEACRRLDALGGPVAEVPNREMCSMVYGGPERARVTGTWRGRPVDESYSRGNGCQTARWDRMGPVLPKIGPERPSHG